MERVERLLAAGEMMNTVAEARAVWRQNPGQTFLREDILAGVECAVASTGDVLGVEAFKRLKKGKEHLSNQTSAAKFQEVLATIISQFENDCAVALFQEMKEAQVLQEELGRRVLAYCDILYNKKLPVISATMWMAARCLGACLPQEAYQCTMKAFALNPDLQKNLGMPGPQYTPHETQYTEHCFACGGEGKPYFAAQSVRAINYEPFFEPCKLWMRCAKCGTLFAYNFPVLTQEDFVGCDTSDSESDILPRFSLHIVSDVLLSIQAKNPGRRLLEVGVGNGELMAVAAEMGYEVEGVEIALKEAEKIHTQLNLTVHCCDFLQYDVNKQYDIISMGDVIEHMAQPIEGVKKAHQLLAPEGILLLSTPNYQSAFSRYYKFNDPMWCEPWHMSYFSLESLKPFLQEIGFQLLEYRVSSHYNGSMELILQKNK